MRESNQKIAESTGILVTPKKFEKTIILVHGLLSKCDHHLIYEASHFFALNGYQTFRYNHHKIGETLMNSAKWLRKIIDYFSYISIGVDHNFTKRKIKMSLYKKSLLFLNA